MYYIIKQPRPQASTGSNAMFNLRWLPYSKDMISDTRVYTSSWNCGKQCLASSGGQKYPNSQKKHIAAIFSNIFDFN